MNMKRYLTIALVLIAMSAFAGPIFHIVCRECGGRVRNESVKLPEPERDRENHDQWFFWQGTGRMCMSFYGVFFCKNCQVFASTNLMEQETADFCRAVKRIEAMEESWPSDAKTKKILLDAERKKIARIYPRLSDQAKRRSPLLRMPCPVCGCDMRWVDIDFTGAEEMKNVTSTNPIALPCPSCSKTGLVVKVTHHFD